MKGRALIPLVVGLAVGVFAVRSFLNVLSKARGTTPVETVQLVRAGVDIAPMVAITEEMLETAEVPRAVVPGGTFDKVEKVVNRVAVGVIPAGVPIVPSLLAPEGTQPGMSSKVRQGYRAVAVQVDEIAGVAGWLKPGGRVDVILVTCGGTAGSMSKVILQNVEVLAVGQTVQSQGTASVTRSVTVSAKPGDASKLALAASRGKLRLTMRNASDYTEPQPDTITVRDLLEDRVAGRDPQARGGSLLGLLFGKPSSVSEDTTDKDKAVPPPVQVAMAIPEPEWVVDVLSGADAYQVRFDSARQGARQTSGPAARPQRCVVPPVPPAGGQTVAPVDEADKKTSDSASQARWE